ncbi:MAG TPA: carboxypeptidase-like regulatory domain-containing protein, partial [Blastocatellia bacterium]|nr:carboxypeptidase-like regulatory domain-containing protein [Blastocatellia bacterium]
MLTGIVRDASTAFVPEAKVTLTSTLTGQSVDLVTGDFGTYTFADIKPGIYSITVEASGFKRYTQEGIRLATGETIRLDLELTVGGANETIVVNADASLLRSETGSLGQVISNRKIVDLPLNGRSFISLAALSPGVALPPALQLPRINGGRPRTNEYLFDGISVLQPEPGQEAFFPIID